MSDPSRWQSLKRILQKFVGHYRETNLGYTAVTVASILFGINGFVPNLWQKFVLGGGALMCLLLSLGYNYWSGRPFGTDVNCTPTHLVEGERQPDVMSEQRNMAMIQGEELVLHGSVRLSRFTNRFKLKLQPSSEIGAELRTKPRSEHEYNPVNNVLSCESVSEYEFPLTIEVFPERDVADGGRYHSLKLIDGSSGRILSEFDVINVNS